VVGGKFGRTSNGFAEPTPFSKAWHPTEGETCKSWNGTFAGTWDSGNSTLLEGSQHAVLGSLWWGMGDDRYDGDGADASVAFTQSLMYDCSR